MDVTSIPQRKKPTEVSGANQAGIVGYTERGTKIVQPGSDMDRSAFLRILSAELSNQDPTNSKDGTEFVTQMAQFSGLEQMANLNNVMRFSVSSSLMNKAVMLKEVDDNGNLITGLVTGISKSGDSAKVSVFVGRTKDEDGNVIDDIRDYALEDILSMSDFKDPLVDQVNNNVNFFTASNLIGKYAQFATMDKTGNTEYSTGAVKTVYKKGSDIILNVQVGENGGVPEMKEFSYTSLVKVSEDPIPKDNNNNSSNSGTSTPSTTAANTTI